MFDRNDATISSIAYQYQYAVILLTFNKPVSPRAYREVRDTATGKRGIFLVWESTTSVKQGAHFPTSALVTTPSYAPIPLFLYHPQEIQPAMAYYMQACDHNSGTITLKQYGILYYFAYNRY